MTGVELSAAEVDCVLRCLDGVLRCLDGAPAGPMKANVLAAVAQIVAARLAPVEAERDEARGERPSGFWSQRQWEDWSNDLATLIPEDKQAGNPEGSQESIIEDTVRHLVAEVARLTAELRAFHLSHGPAMYERAMDDMLARAEAAEARAAKAEALVEAGLGLADEWEQLANLASGTVAVPVVLRAHAQELHAVLGGVK